MSDLLKRLRIFSIQLGPGGSTRGIVDEAIGHIQQLELDAAGNLEALSKIDKINQQVCAQRDEAEAALLLMQKHQDDLGKSNPGFMGKLVLQHYDVWNEALIAMDETCAKIRARRTPGKSTTAEYFKSLGYEVIEASAFEVGLVKNGKGIRTWFAQDFYGIMPTLDHPKISAACRINEDQ